MKLSAVNNLRKAKFEGKSAASIKREVNKGLKAIEAEIETRAIITPLDGEKKPIALHDHLRWTDGQFVREFDVSGFIEHADGWLVVDPYLQTALASQCVHCEPNQNRALLAEMLQACGCENPEAEFGAVLDDFTRRIDER
ncbi:MAG: hypothetical protein IJ111_14865 [Eggerthellaceae bacterium]|nr:hypothetical protein [Eggerthellaceae bacterium]